MEVGFRPGPFGRALQGSGVEAGLVVITKRTTSMTVECQPTYALLLPRGFDEKKTRFWHTQNAARPPADFAVGDLGSENGQAKPTSFSAAQSPTFRAKSPP